MSLWDAIGRLVAVTPPKAPAKEKPKPLPPTGPIREDDDGYEDDEAQAQRDERHEFLILWFRRLRADTEDRIEQLTERLASGEIDSDGWAVAMRTELTKAHTEARSIGRRLAGHVGPFDQDDVAGGAADWARQEEFFQGLLEDLETGRYTKPDGTLNARALNARGGQYAAALRGTANRSFKEAMAQEVLRWMLGLADHCKPSKDFPYDCPSLSEQEPKPADQWDTEPAGGRTPCRNFCTCYFLSEDSKYSTEGI